MNRTLSLDAVLFIINPIELSASVLSFFVNPIGALGSRFDMSVLLTARKKLRHDLGSRFDMSSCFLPPEKIQQMPRVKTKMSTARGILQEVSETGQTRMRGRWVAWSHHSSTSISQRYQWEKLPRNLGATGVEKFMENFFSWREFQDHQKGRRKLSGKIHGEFFLLAGISGPSKGASETFSIRVGRGKVKYKVKY